VSVISIRSQELYVIPTHRCRSYRNLAKIDTLESKGLTSRRK
jgi:hypothetical protein